MNKTLNREIVLKDFYKFSDNIISELVQALYYNNFEVIFRHNDASYAPVGVAPNLLDPLSYQQMFQEEHAVFKYFLLSFNGSKQKYIYPLGTFGVNPKAKIYFPLLLNSFGLQFLSAGMDQIKAVLSEENNRDDFDNIFLVRKYLLKKIFVAYYRENPEFNSLMAWPMRNKKSLTRKIALSTRFIRKEFLSTEVYCSNEVGLEDWQYIKNTILRSVQIFNHGGEKSREQNFSPFEDIKKIAQFYENLLIQKQLT